MRLPLTQIRTDGDTQPRCKLEPATVTEYAEAWRAGAAFPPLVVFRDGTDYWLAEGFHRHAGAVEAGLESVECDVRQGTVEDARWFALSANTTHGLKRSPADKRRAVELALKTRPDMSDRAIAEHCGVSYALVADVRRQVPDSGTWDSKRTGRDGKTYPSRPRKKPAPRNGAPEPTGDWHTDVRGPEAEAFLEVTDKGVPALCDLVNGEKIGLADAAKVAALPAEQQERAVEHLTAGLRVTEAIAKAQEAEDPTRDMAGLIIPEAARPAFEVAKKIDALISHIRKAERMVDEIAKASPGGELLLRACHMRVNGERQTYQLERLHNAIRDLKRCRPYSGTCPYCLEAGAKKPRKDCTACRGLPYVDEGAYDGLPRECKIVVDRLRRQQQEGEQG